MYEPLIHRLLNRDVVCRVENLTVKGKLVSYQTNSNAEQHRPQVLILERNGRKLIVRGDWQSIGTASKRKGDSQR